VACWNRSRHGIPRRGGHPAAAAAAAAATTAAAPRPRRCLPCPDCVRCAVGGELTVRPHYALAIGPALRPPSPHPYPPASTAAESTPGLAVEGAWLNVFRCDSGGCLGGSGHSCGGNHSGLLCGTCRNGFRLHKGDCLLCGAVTPEQWLLMAFMVLAAVIVGVGWKLGVGTATKQKAHFWLLVVEKSWPRFRQSYRIWVGNYQIVSRIAAVCEVQWPPWAASVAASVGGVVNVQLFSLPGISCLVSYSFYSRWTAKMLLIPSLSLLTVLLYQRAVRDFATQLQQLARESSTAPAQSGAPAPLLSLSHKLRMAVQIGRLRTRYSSWLFTAVYLLYASCCTATFAMFKCRKLDYEAEYLLADMRVPCVAANGEYDPTYRIFYALAALCTIAYPIGIPLGLGTMLYKQRATVQKNPDYVTLVISSTAYCCRKTLPITATSAQRDALIS
jgi:hypothetical protein